MIEQEFIPYEQALALKELGFDEYCFAIYNLGLSEFETANIGQIRLFSSIFKINDKQSNTSYVNNKDISKVTAPLYQQAFRWFREKYKLNSSIELTDNSRHYYYDFTIYDSKNRDYNDEECFDSCKRIYDDRKFSKYEEAQLECLKKLIKICKKN